MKTNANSKIVAFDRKEVADPVTEKRFDTFVRNNNFYIDHNLLLESMPEYCRNNIWDMNGLPVGIKRKKISEQSRYLRFECKKERLTIELKTALWERYATGRWSATSNGLLTETRRVCKFLNATNPPVKSFLDFSLAKWELLLNTYLVNTKQLVLYDNTKINSQQQSVTDIRSARSVEVLRVVYRTLEEIYDIRPENKRDVWDLKKLGARINPTRTENILNFTHIYPVWLRETVKTYLYPLVMNRSAATSRTKLIALKKFGNFITQHSPQLLPEEINRELLLNYISYLATEDLTDNIRLDYLMALRKFLEEAAFNNWLPIREKRMLFTEDFPRKTKRKPRFIPDFVIGQLETMLPEMTTQLRRMVMIIKECGMRVSELCEMRLDCLQEDAEGYFFLFYHQRKMSKEHTIPISRETADAIKEQRSEILERNLKTVYLFPRRDGSEPYRCSTFNRQLNAFAYAKKIADETGKLWHFHSHAFRHTVGTRMINNNVPQHIVQKYLGHESADMTAVYAHIHDKTLKKEFEKYLTERGDLIDITGSIIEREQPTEADNADLQWFKKNIQAQVLPNGFCGLPAVQTACPHANACLSCASFRTDASFLPQHKEQLQKTQQLVQISRTNGWARQTEMNEKLTKNLETIINKLEINPEKVTQETSEENN